MQNLFTIIFRWLARLLGIFLFLFFAWFAIEFGIDDPSKMNPHLMKLFYSHMLMMFALVLVWRFELLGGLILIVAYSYFSIINHTFWTNPIYPIFFLIGLLHLLSWFFRYGMRVFKGQFSPRYLFR
ncbi:hypothetical protein EO244_12030 [Ancylomarina salipaludis]|uniref:DUF7670 domain-containing protein n=1 Tax=Ancylomarina salipaludis TaxID=2501299 RepID=A0A4V1MZX6_9BACT|nr:hypothetical protein [Ancylomarina salipaludis]RXQ91474.1 hypothetical protein EO244_12030 [Ancylomarina salipaludis]